MDLHPEARFIVETLVKAGFIAYYAGGWVRDFLLQQPSDDIDIATNAPPETIQALFPHTVPIGIAFGIILVIIEEKQYEVATFRQDFDYQDGRRPSKVVFTTALEDAKRRDFTINGMFYDPLHDEILDYVGGKADLEAKRIRAIGDPHERIQEDRLRMIRAVRFACRFQFTIEEKTKEAIHAHAKELFPAVAIERVWQEFCKGSKGGNFQKMLLQLHEFGLLSTIFPALVGISKQELQMRLGPPLPLQAPVIVSILFLFPQITLNEQLEICQRFKLSKSEQQFVIFLNHARALLQFKNSLERIEWVYFYADPRAFLCLEILQEPVAFHLEKMEELKFWIVRVQEKKPLLSSEHLLKEGIEPGPLMGLLLKEAERIAVNQELKAPDIILKKIKESSLWPKDFSF